MKTRNCVLVALVALGMATALPTVANAATGTIERDCTGVRFFGTVAAGEIVKLEVRLHADATWQSVRLQDDVQLVITATYDVTIPWVTDPTGKLNRTAISVSTDGGSTYTTIALNENFLDCTPPGGEGCTPGYWKNHLEDWAATGYAPTDDFDTTFGVDLFNPDITLEQAVNAKGGGVHRLARHGVAALLSAAHPSVDYPYTVDEVIALVKSGNADPLVAANELGCDIR